MNRQLIPALVLWLVLTVVGEVLAATVDFYIVPMSNKGEEIDASFRFLVYMAIPVFTLVVAVLATSVAMRSSVKFPDEDGPPLQGHGPFPMVWVGVTSCLALIIMVYPGLYGIPRVVHQTNNPDVLVKVDGVQWTWLVSYPNENIDGVREIVLPVDSTVRFDITSRDVLHSFWIPAFLLKIDAVPGLTTKLSLKTTKEGSYATDPYLRVQCAQLCGLSHSRMRMPVRVVSKAEYDAWVQEQTGTPNANVTPTGPITELTLVAKNITWDAKTLTVPAGSTVKLTVDNQDNAIPHNFSLYASEQAATSGEKPLAGTKPTAGPVQEDLTFNAPAPGTYYFRCDVHPTTMTGTFIVQ
jgi:cytochrome c oxidase subunit II